jgi:hypothetical protein
VTGSPWQSLRDEVQAAELRAARAPAKASLTSWLRHGCLQCAHVNVPQPDDWTPAYEGDRWRRSAAINYIREKHQHLPAICMLRTGWDVCRTDLYCGDFKYYQELSPPLLSEEIFGDYWRHRGNELAKENVELKRQLKAAREQSAKRLARLKKQQQVKEAGA